MSALEWIYLAIGLFIIYAAYANFMDKEHSRGPSSGLFWLALGITLAFGQFIPDVINGLLVVLLAVICAFNAVQRGSAKEVSLDYRQKELKRLGSRPLLAVLLIPVFAFGFTLIDIPQAPLVGLGVGAIVAGIAAILLTNDNFGSLMSEGRRINDSVGWAMILPPFLGALGAIFNAAGVGPVIADLVSRVLPVDNILGAIVAYAVGMALFTIIMGNAFAAFAVITTGIGIPLVIVAQGANPNIIAPMAMTAGYCGTLVTIMAANFNIVPSALLELKDKYRVIKEQIQVAVPLFLIHIALMYFFAF